jgi:beta-glucosidase
MMPNESKQIYFNISIKKLAFYDINMKFCVEKGNFEFMVGGSSKDSSLVKASLELLDRYNL